MIVQMAQVSTRTSEKETQFWEPEKSHPQPVGVGEMSRYSDECSALGKYVKDDEEELEKAKQNESAEISARC